MNKKITTISMILILAITTLGSLAVSAQPAPKKTYVFIGLIPDEVGVGQEVLIHLGIFTPSENVYWGWEGLTVTVTKPDGTKQTLGPYTTDSTGGTGGAFIPNQVGTYTLQSHFPEQPVQESFFSLESGIFFTEGQIMLASDSEVVELVVTEDPIEYYPGVPLPTEFWSRPVDSNFREWSTISGNWLERTKNHLADFNDAPETAHILWAEPYTFGGVAGGETGTNAFEDGDAYEGKFQGSIIISGVLYYNRFTRTGRGAAPAQGIVALDLRTGEELWFKNNSRISHGQTYYFTDFNYHGVFDYIWETSGSTWDAYDPFTGEWIYGMTDVPSGVRYTGDNGDFYIVVTDLENGWVALWSQHLAATHSLIGGGSSEGSWGRYVHGNVFNASESGSFMWNHTIPAGLPNTNLGSFLGSNQVIDDRFLSVSFNPDRTELRAWAVGLAENNAGVILFDKTWNTPSEWSEGMLTIHYTSHTDYGPGGVFVVWAKEIQTHYGFSLDTGNFLWETAESEHYLQSYGWSYIEHSWHIAYDKLYSTGVSGILYCYDVFTGELLWTYESEDPYSEYLFANNFWNWISFISDGKVYMAHTEHSAVDPKPRGAPFVCLDAETGDVVWKTEGMFRSTRWGGQGIIGDSIMALMDTYDLRIYAVGKGPSQTTVEAPKAGIPEGSSVVICGTVTDVSAGASSPELAARFPNGIAAVADESMSDWMEYVYKQFPFPSDATGVDVSLDVIDSNGNFRNIGTATSDSSGFYSFDWMPDIPGKYTVVATFAGSEGYYPSYAEAAFVVDQSPEATPEPTATPAPQTDTYIAGSTIAIIAAIAVVAFLLLRKK